MLDAGYSILDVAAQPGKPSGLGCAGRRGGFKVPTGNGWILA